MDFNCYHECENCGNRCNCADQPCSCCIVNKIKSPCCTMIKTPIHKNQTVWAKLHTEKRKHIVKSNVYEGDFYVYKCEMCGTGYTTTESDTLSLNNLKQKKTMNSKLIKKHDEARLTDTNTNGKLLLNAEISKEVAVKFGRYLLKEATHHWDKDATLCWKVANEEFDTLFLFDKFMEESF